MLMTGNLTIHRRHLSIKEGIVGMSKSLTLAVCNVRVRICMRTAGALVYAFAAGGDCYIYYIASCPPRRLIAALVRDRHRTSPT